MNHLDGIPLYAGSNQVCRGQCTDPSTLVCFATTTVGRRCDEDRARDIDLFNGKSTGLRISSSALTNVKKILRWRKSSSSTEMNH